MREIIDLFVDQGVIEFICWIIFVDGLELEYMFDEDVDEV